MVKNGRILGLRQENMEKEETQTSHIRDLMDHIMEGERNRRKVSCKAKQRKKDDETIMIPQLDVIRLIGLGTGFGGIVQCECKRK